MSERHLYRGVWPQNVSTLAKYVVKFLDGQWKVTVRYNPGPQLTYLAVEGGRADVAASVNAVKTDLRDQPGGAFYVNEYRHILVPVASPDGERATSNYYCAGRLESDFTFDFEDQPLTTRPQRPDGTPLTPSDQWVGPRPGIPYVLSAGAGDIYFESPALTDEDPPKVRPSVTRKVLLSKVLGDKTLLKQAVAPLASIRGHQGGRFYVNEHGAMFTPVGAGDGDGIHYVYCGQIDRGAWFAEPPV